MRQKAAAGSVLIADGAGIRTSALDLDSARGHPREQSYLAEPTRF